ncbi:hypothetical protein RFI_20381 [Reticulomyxa filosa]|uniref:Rab-GAP TBC domain-containing protein n=1 Tax=Reticulomyxa filosa TaxID=46433 RepID=X6MT09_RETFI|nr:hypothetical protein RFI_20381 [Reticulomyxa filosa]|eukprot:ETO16954.1 hypothetical protein RFI_20381 [Reticulomyxa filosa]
MNEVEGKRIKTRKERGKKKKSCFCFGFVHKTFVKGYSPRNLLRRESTLANKRKRYRDLIELYYNNKTQEHRSNPENKIIHQIGLDVPRTLPILKYFQIDNIKKLLTRALYIWSHHHTATGYVQGINDLITPFVYVLIHKKVTFYHSLYRRVSFWQKKKKGTKFNVNIEDSQSMKLIASLKEEELLDVEADSYWCLDEFLESLQMNYTHDQPGIQRMMEKFQCLVEECDTTFINGVQTISQTQGFVLFGFACFISFFFACA